MNCYIYDIRAIMYSRDKELPSFDIFDELKEVHFLYVIIIKTATTTALRASFRSSITVQV